jgi:hypothetical protein
MSAVKASASMLGAQTCGGRRAGARSRTGRGSGAVALRDADGRSQPGGLGFEMRNHRFFRRPRQVGDAKTAQPRHARGWSNWRALRSRRPWVSRTAKTAPPHVVRQKVFEYGVEGAPGAGSRPDASDGARTSLTAGSASLLAGEDRAGLCVPSGVARYASTADRCGLRPRRVGVFEQIFGNGQQDGAPLS